MNNKSLIDWCPIHSCKREECFKYGDGCVSSGKSYIAYQFDKQICDQINKPTRSIETWIAQQHLKDPNWFKLSEDELELERQVKNIPVQSDTMKTGAERMLELWYSLPMPCPYEGDIILLMQRRRIKYAQERHHYERLIQHLHLTTGDIFTQTDEDLKDFIRRNRNTNFPTYYNAVRHAYELLKRREMSRNRREEKEYCCICGASDLKNGGAITDLEKVRKTYCEKCFYITKACLRMRKARAEYQNCRTEFIEEAHFSVGDILSPEASGMGKDLGTALSSVHLQPPSAGCGSTRNQMPAQSGDEIYYCHYRGCDGHRTGR